MEPVSPDDAYHLDFSGDTQLALDAVAKWQADRGIYRNIITRHQPGGEGLITFAPNQPPIITYAGDAVGPKFADLGITPIAPTPTPGTTFTPTLFVTSTAGLLAGLRPADPGYEWTQAWDWPTETADWQQQYDSLNPPIVITLTTQPQPQLLVPVAATPNGQGGVNWRPIVIGGVLVGTLMLGAGAGFVFFNNQGGPLIAGVAVAVAVAGTGSSNAASHSRPTNRPAAGRSADGSSNGCPDGRPDRAARLGRVLGAHRTGARRRADRRVSFRHQQAGR